MSSRVSGSREDRFGMRVCEAPFPPGGRAGPIRRALAAALVLVAATGVALAFTGAAGAATNISNAIQPIAPFSAGTFDSGQGVDVVISAAAGSAAGFTSGHQLFIFECAAPAGVDPTMTTECDGNTNYGGGTISVNSDDSVDVVNGSSASGLPYQMFALPDPLIGDGNGGAGATCGLGSPNDCVLDISESGTSDTGMSQPHVFSQVFQVHPDSTDSGTINPGDGTFGADAAPGPISTANHATFTEDTSNTFDISATGYGPPTFTETGALPTGVHLTTTFSGLTSTGVLSGRPSVTGTFPITLQASNGVGSPTTQAFTLTVVSGGTAPTVTSISPTSGPAGGGTPVTVTGTNFTGATAVHFGSTAASSFTVNSAVSISTTSPAGTGLVDVTVTTPAGTSATSANDQFTYGSGSSAPGAPTNLAATLGVGQATLSWTAPNDNGSAITSYTVDITDNTTSTTATPVTVSGSPPATNADLTGLTPGDSYSFTVTATNSAGTGPASSALTDLLPAPYFPVAPARICDTRASNTTQCHGKTLSAGGTLKVQVTGNGGVPAGATAVVANVTVTGATAQSFLTAYPDGTTRPLASNLNFGAGQTVPNLVTVPLSSGGAIDLYNALGTVNALVDVDGYYGPGSGQGFTSLTPSRICDTRASNTTECHGQTLSAGGNLKVQVTGEGGVPVGATAVVANVTVTGPTAASFLTAYADGSTRPLASNLNFTAGESVPNRVIVPLSGTGALDLYNALGSVNAIVDVDGYFNSSVSGYFEPVAPARICDTRASNTTQCHGKTLSAAGTLDVQVTGNGGIPAGAAAVVANVTATGASAQSFLTVYPEGASKPLASDLNFTGGETVPNLCVAKLSATGGLAIYNALGSVNALVDVAGWFTS